jgi:RecG-like helicase
VALRKFVERLTKPTDELDREKLTTWCDIRGGAPLDAVKTREPVHIAGEVRSLRIVPRAGAAALEATIMDGRGTVIAVFLGRRRIAGFKPGRRVMLDGVVTQHGGDRYMYNPVYTLE